MSESKNIIDPNEYQRRVLERRVKWSQEYPELAPTKHRSDESMVDAYSTLSLRRALFRYMEIIHPNDEFSDEVVRQYRNIDPKVRIFTDEIDERCDEDNKLAALGEDPVSIQNKKREETGRIVKKELENAIGDAEGGKNPTLVLIDRQALDEESEIANNPARSFERSMTQQLQRQMGRELKRAFDPHRTRPRMEDDSVSEELDKPAVTKEPTGRFKDVVAVAEEEITAAVDKLLPKDDAWIAAKIRQDWLDKKYREAEE